MSAPADGALDYCNFQWRAYTGLTLDEVQGDGWKRMIHPDDLERVAAAWRESVSTGTSYEQEERHRRFDGTYRWFLSRVVPQRDAAGRIERWFGSSTDIEDRKGAEEALHESERRFKQAQLYARLGYWEHDLFATSWVRSGDVGRRRRAEPQSACGRRIKLPADATVEDAVVVSHCLLLDRWPRLAASIWRCRAQSGRSVAPHLLPAPS